MKTKHIFFIMLLSAIMLNAQNRTVAIGFISSHFHNNTINSGISNADNPYAYGIVAAYQLDEQLSFAVTAEYSDADLQRYEGTEKDFRSHLSFYLTPVNLGFARPYISGGIVYSTKDINYASTNLKDKTENKIYGRYGLGVDVPVINNIAVNGDLGAYTNGLKYIGWSGSVGLRYGFSL